MKVFKNIKRHANLNNIFYLKILIVCEESAEKKRTGRQDRNKMGKVMKEKYRKVYGYKKDGKNNDENENR